MFDGTLDTWKTYPFNFKLKENSKPIHLQTYPVPKLHEEMFKIEEKKLVLLEGYWKDK